MRGHSYLLATAAAVVMGSVGLPVQAGQLVLIAATADTVDTTNLVGKTIVDPQGKTIGKIDGVLVDAAGKVKYVVVGVGGFLGIGEKDVALRWEELGNQTGDKLTANVTKDQLTSLPGYRFSDAKRRGSVYSYDEDLASNPYLAENPATPTMNPATPLPSSNETRTTDAMKDVPPLPGANSFTETQARSRIERQGFVSVSSLKKDDQGVWRGTAMKDGKTVNVALDYKGNVVAQ